MAKNLGASPVIAQSPPLSAFNSTTVCRCSSVTSCLAVNITEFDWIGWILSTVLLLLVLMLLMTCYNRCWDFFSWLFSSKPVQQPPKRGGGGGGGGVNTVILMQQK